MKHKMSRFTRLLAGFLVFIMILSVPLSSAADNEIPDEQGPAASEQLDNEAENPPEVAEPTLDPDPAEEEPTDPTPDPDPTEVGPTEPSLDPDPAEEEPTEPTPDPNPAEEEPTEPSPDPDLAEGEPTEPSPDLNDPDAAPSEDDTDEEDNALTDEEEEEAGEDEEIIEEETEEISVEEFEALLREFNNMRASDTVPSSMYVDPSDTNGVTERVSIVVSRVTKTRTTSTSWWNNTVVYTFNVTCSLTLPETAVVSQCRFSWDSTLKANYNNTEYESGNVPVPAFGQTEQYTFTRDKNGENYTIIFAVTTDDLPTAMWIKSSKSNGLSEQVNVEISSKATVEGTTTYTCDLVLPYGAILDGDKGCRFTWSGDLKACVDGQEYASGKCPVPAVGETKTYSFSKPDGDRTAVFVITAYAALPDAMWVQLSETQKLFIEENGSTYNLKLPFGLPEDCLFSWNSDLTATSDNQVYASGECPVPDNNAQRSYSFSNGKNSVTFTVKTSVIEPKLRVEPSDSNGIPAQIDVFVSDTTSSGGYYNTTTTYTCELYLPGNADVDSCTLSWDGSIKAKVSNEEFVSGECAIPAVGSTITYTFQNGKKKWEYVIQTYQGSSSVQAVFIDIDETKGTIAAMDSDPDHETECSGQIWINGTKYTLTKMKGRGNYTWEKAQDKKPYNITLDKAINFPGVSSGTTKKWSFLAEIFDPSLLCNRSGYWLACQLGVGQDTTSADVWMNGEYQGCYTVTPKTDSFVPSGGFMVEEDNYLEFPVVAGGDAQFTLEGLIEASGWSSCYNRITVKEMDGNWTAESIQSWLQEAWNAIMASDGKNSNGRHYTEYIDIESFARMYLMHEYVKSYDVCAGSILFTCSGDSSTGKLMAGPLWDLDNAMGSTYNNGSLGSAGDRRSGQGDFIPNIDEYKTSFFKALFSHNDFREEVSRQYRMNSSAFDSLPSKIDELSGSIAASATMNHKKVQKITGSGTNDNHVYNSTTTIDGQTFVATGGVWSNYVQNLRTYAAARSAWFQSSASFHDYDYACVHNWVRTVTQEPTCESMGTATYTCSNCNDSYAEDLEALGHEYQDNGICSRCGKEALKATIVCDSGASVTVYKTQDLVDGSHFDNAQAAFPRNSDTGVIDCSGDGQINFVVLLEDGRQLESVTAAPKAYNKIKDQADSRVPNSYRITKVSGDFTINVTVSKFVTFDVNGRCDAPPRQIVTTGSAAQDPGTPTATGYLFGGWYTDAACTGEPYDFSTPVTGDLTLYANWTQIFPVPEFKSHTLLLSGEIGVNFYMDLSILSAEERQTATMEFTVNGRTRTDTFDESFTNPSTHTYYGFTCYINSVQMADTIQAVLHYIHNGENLTVSQTYSAKMYVDYILNHTDDYSPSAVALVKAIADYGHYVQPFLAANNGWTLGTDHVVMENANTYSEADVEAARAAVADLAFFRDLGDSHIEAVTYSLDLETETAIRIYLKVKEDYTGEVTATMGDRSLDCAMQSDGRYRIEIGGISAHKLRDSYTVTVSAGGDCTITVCALSYVNTVLNMDGSTFNNDTAHYAVTSLYRYYAATMAYRAETNR